MTAVVVATGLTRIFGSFAAVSDASFDVHEHSICGLLGRNGAGKTTLMHLVTGQDFHTSGHVELFGQTPHENAAVLARTCFIKESQTYPDGFKGKHALRAAAAIFPHWDAALAAELVEEFAVPLGRKMKRMSRGQQSAIGVIIGIASRAELTVFDEPYAGLDAVARHIFYDRLLKDYGEHPRTILMSTHLIDEVADMLDHVIVIDEGRIIIDSPSDDLRGAAVTVAGKHGAVTELVEGLEVISWDSLGGLASATVAGLTQSKRDDARRLGVEIGPVTLQQLIIGRTRGTVRTENAS